MKVRRARPARFSYHANQTEQSAARCHVVRGFAGEEAMRPHRNGCGLSSEPVDGPGPPQRRPTRPMDGILAFSVHDLVQILSGGLMCGTGSITPLLWVLLGWLLSRVADWWLVRFWGANRPRPLSGCADRPLASSVGSSPNLP